MCCGFVQFLSECQGDAVQFGLKRLNIYTDDLAVHPFKLLLDYALGLLYKN